MIGRFKRWLALRWIERHRKPDPDYRRRRLAQFTPERRERYFRNVEFLG